MQTKIRVDIVSDVSCPWCIIGYQSFMQALVHLGLENDVDIQWKAFELNPNMPPEGQDKREHLAQKYGITDAQIKQNRQHIIDRGAELGFTFNYQADSRVYNTFNAHRLLHWSAEYGLQTQLKRALFDLYFTDNGNPSDTESLLKLVADVGLDRAEAQAIISSDQYAQAVRQEQLHYQQAGVRSVPAFIFQQKHLISGGQPPVVFAKFLEKLKTGDLDN